MYLNVAFNGRTGVFDCTDCKARDVASDRFELFACSASIDSSN